MLKCEPIRDGTTRTGTFPVLKNAPVHHNRSKCEIIRKYSCHLGRLFVNRNAKLINFFEFFTT